jgi:hypothetical protein
VVSELITSNELFLESSATPNLGSIKAAAGSGTSHCGPVRTAVIAENAAVGCWCPQKGTMCNRRAPKACKDTLLTARFQIRPLIPASFTCTGASGHRLINCPAGGANQHLKCTAAFPTALTWCAAAAVRTGAGSVSAQGNRTARLLLHAADSCGYHGVEQYGGWGCGGVGRV